MFIWVSKKKKKKIHERELHNARCRRYYQRHLSKKARQKELRQQLKKKATKKLLEEPKKEPEQYLVGEPTNLL
jgi:mevalonate pyrophosphate decarboxylase